MPGYFPQALKQFVHEPPPKLKNQPYPHAPPNYEAKLQYAKAIDNSHPLSEGNKTFVVKLTGTFLFYAREIDSTMFPVISTIASEQNVPIKNTMKRVKKFLDYPASQEEAIIMFNASGMVLEIHSDASYLSKNNSRSCAGGHHLISSNK